MRRPFHLTVLRTDENDLAAVVDRASIETLLDFFVYLNSSTREGIWIDSGISGAGFGRINEVLELASDLISGTLLRLGAGVSGRCFNTRVYSTNVTFSSTATRLYLVSKASHSDREYGSSTSTKLSRRSTSAVSQFCAPLVRPPRFLVGPTDFVFALDDFSCAN